MISKMRVIALLALCLAAVAAVSTNPQRIIGGSQTTITQYPSMAALLFSNIGFRQACGGTIINNRSILTAGRCTYGFAPSRWRVRVGSTSANSGGDVHNAQTIIYHPSWTNHDLAIIHVSSEFSINHHTIARASLAGPNYETTHNMPVWAAGWGRTRVGGTNVEQLHHVQNWVVAQSICAQRYAPLGVRVHEGMVCAGWLDFSSRDQCFGDEGGPLLHNGVLVGVFSFGPNPCNDIRIPAINTRVSFYISWIRDNA